MILRVLFEICEKVSWMGALLLILMFLSSTYACAIYLEKARCEAESRNKKYYLDCQPIGVGNLHDQVTRGKQGTGLDYNDDWFIILDETEVALF